MSAVRPGTASHLKSAQIQSRGGTASRLASGAKADARNRAVNGSALNTIVCVEDRPITQQGLRGLKSAVRGPKRQVEDKSYFLGLLRGKIDEINSEIGTITRQLTEKEEEDASFVQYEQMAEKLAYEIKELQGELQDYNTLVDKATLGDNITSIEMDLEDVQAANQRAEQNLEILFEDSQRRELSLKSCELELQEEQQLSEKVIQEMSGKERERYFKLKDLNAHLLNQLSEGQVELEELKVRKAELEEELSTSAIKQEAVRLFSQLHEVQNRRDQLLSEENSEEDPQKERQRLLQQVKNDNQEIAAIEKQKHAIQEKIASKEEELQILEQELDENHQERNQKYRELKKREQQIDEFLETFDYSKSLEISGINEIQSTIIDILNRTSNYIIRLNQTSSELDFELPSAESIVQQETAEVVKSGESIQNLTRERRRLHQDLLKVNHIESKITQEMETLKKRISKMEEEIVIFNDLDKVRDDAILRRQTLNNEKSRFNVYNDNLNKFNQQLSTDYDQLQRNLTQQDTYLHLNNLIQRWIQHEQVNYALNEFIVNKRIEMNSSKLMQNTMELVRNYNEHLKYSLLSK
ncbi:Intraflagellar transport protein 74 like [Schistosoma japonicum]|nr:Intraflagellar transport protein 74 like [Schistosoma japonicum]KAH8856839.1 Intraflagellar transport protein 74 like [Schistosoma japonicum]